MLKHWQIGLVLILLFCLIFNCSKSTRNENDEVIKEPPPVSSTPKDNEEAELMALCLSGELVAPDSLYDRILNDLADIRASFGDTIEAVTLIEFRAPWVAGCVMIGFDDTTFQQILDGQYHAWDTLNEQYQVIQMHTMPIGGSGAVLLIFAGRLHPRRLAEIYAPLPGVRTTHPNGIIGDCPNVYARDTEDELTYLFRNAWGDCPSGCIYSEYCYFVFEGAQPRLVGHWPAYQGVEAPDWWEEARLNKEHYCD
ncbi:MAG: hypothetical protein GTO24_26225 [candidate division Zixibacteria bacterium]|nr:hypothetical protein [candidate division Zixibacteria bacterium]